MPQFIDFPVEGVITGTFGGVHGGIDIAGGPIGEPVFAPDGGWATRHWPGDGWGDGSFGNCVIITHADGLHSIYAHLQMHTIQYDQQVDVGTRLGVMGWTGLVRPAGPGGAHVHWGLCDDPRFPSYPSSPSSFRDPLNYLISESERMTLFKRLEYLERMVAGDPVSASMWVEGGNISLKDCLGQQPGRVRELFEPDFSRGGAPRWDGILAQTYGTNDLLNRWRQALAAQGIQLPQ